MILLTAEVISLPEKCKLPVYFPQYMNKFCLLFLLFFAVCQKYGVVMHQQRMNASYLASTHVGSPDPARRDPPNGEMLIAEWWVPRSVMQRDPKIVIEIIFRNFTKGCVEFPLTSRVGYQTYCVLRKKFKETGGILTYKAEIIPCDDEIYRQWEHQLWVNLITVGEEGASTLD